jgi:hypothetical protein
LALQCTSPASCLFLERSHRCHSGVHHHQSTHCIRFLLRFPPSANCSISTTNIVLAMAHLSGKSPGNMLVALRFFINKLHALDKVLYYRSGKHHLYPPHSRQCILFSLRYTSSATARCGQDIQFSFWCTPFPGRLFLTRSEVVPQVYPINKMPILDHVRCCVSGIRPRQVPGSRKSACSWLWYTPSANREGIRFLL